MSAILSHLSRRDDVVSADENKPNFHSGLSADGRAGKRFHSRLLPETSGVASQS